MSRNSKNARLIREAKAPHRRRAQNGKEGATATGNKGPAKTTPVHNKKRDNRFYWNNSDRKGKDPSGKQKSQSHESS